MNRYLLIASFCIYLLPCFVFAKSENTNQIGKYYSLINDAELNICKNNLEKAYTLYAAAFEIQGAQMSSKNLYNYFIVSAELKKWENCKKVLFIIRQRGWKQNWYKGTVDKYFEPEVAKKLLDIYESLGEVKSINDEAYQSKIDSIINIDQHTNHFFRNQNLGLLSKEGLDSLGKLNRIHLQFLKELFSQKFPTDYVVSGGSPCYGPVYRVLLVHNAQLGKSHVLDSLLYSAVLNGNLPPEEFEYWMDEYHSENINDTILHLRNLKLTMPLFPDPFFRYHDSLFQ